MIINDRLGPQGDDVYAALIAAHDGLDTDQSHALNARLVLILLNEIADPNRIAALLAEARALSSSD
ncbi:DUF2783 domain-containing protein [uncultured Tateyamaria sp.]|uniref:DUF2783 domain-containing protein n=1 Tax=Tateyamaria sp. 1078 TaxID=3417464 RepID=UPI00260826D8|nr:DUF2783 domain-containing protein [uncultured Tateyamaria sp.]